uniref:Claudin i n=1 Tax=Gasterosteus aculeatus aculeatus TaxID=481459 RepID=G3PJY1_GASAC
MGSAAVQIVCVSLGVLGMIGVIISCAVPLWKVTSFTGSNIVTAQVLKTVRRACGRPVWPARALTIISCMFCCLSLLILFCGARLTNFVENEERQSPKMSLVAAVGLLLAGLLVIIPKRELGACIYVGWGPGMLLLLSGGLLCCFSRSKSGGSGGTAKYYSNGAASAPNKNYV